MLKFLGRTLIDLERRKPIVLAELHPLLRIRVEEVIERCGHRLAPYCGHRGIEEQREAFESGASLARPGESPHNHTPALACDLVLDPRRVDVRPHPQDDRYPDLWDDESMDALAAWESLDQWSRAVNLERVTIRGKLDRPHVQMPNWRSLIPQ